MLIQMLVENAIKHGISDQVDGGEVVFKVFRKGLMLNIEVNNTGKLKSHTSSTKIGLQNIQERLRLLYGKRSFFSLTEVGRGSKVVALIKIPLDE